MDVIQRYRDLLQQLQIDKHTASTLVLAERLDALVAHLERTPPAPVTALAPAPAKAEASAQPAQYPVVSLDTPDPLASLRVPLVRIHIMTPGDCTNEVV